MNTVRFDFCSFSLSQTEGLRARYYASDVNSRLTRSLPDEIA